MTHFPTRNEYKSQSDLTDEERKSLLSILAGTISHRIKNMTEDKIKNLFGGFVMEDTPIVQEILQRKKQQWVGQGMQQVLLRLIAARFGVVPEDIRQKIELMNDTENLERIATLLLTIQSVDDLKNLVN